VVQPPVFANGIAANTALYQVTSADAATCVAAVNDCTAKYAVWNNPATRTIGSLEAKDASKASALGICRVFYGLIQRNVGISDENKLLIGVTPMNNSRTPRPCPSTAPSMTIVASTPGALTAQFRDGTDGRGGAKFVGRMWHKRWRVFSLFSVGRPA
jgi:hypothetical protein